MRCHFLALLQTKKGSTPAEIGVGFRGMGQAAGCPRWNAGAPRVEAAPQRFTITARSWCNSQTSAISAGHAPSSWRRRSLGSLPFLPDRGDCLGPDPGMLQRVDELVRGVPARLYFPVRVTGLIENPEGSVRPVPWEEVTSSPHKKWYLYERSWVGGERPQANMRIGSNVASLD